MTQISQLPPAAPAAAPTVPTTAALKVTVVPDDGGETEHFFVFGVPLSLPINLVELIGSGTVFEHGFDMDVEYTLDLTPWEKKEAKQMFDVTQDEFDLMVDMLIRETGKSKAEAITEVAEKVGWPASQEVG